MKTEPFLNNLWSAELVLKEIGRTSKVYPCENIFIAFNLSESIEGLNFLFNHGEHISEANKLKESFANYFDDDIERVQREFGYEPENGKFEPMEFLKATSVDILTFIDKHGKDHLCWPREQRESLEPCFKNYHRYKFLERYMGQLPDGINLFLQRLPDFVEPIERAKIADSFYWREHDIQFLYDYKTAHLELEQRVKDSDRENEGKFYRRVSPKNLHTEA